MEEFTLDLDFLNIEENLSHQLFSCLGMKIGVLIDLDSLDTGLEGGKKDIRGGAIDTVSCAMVPFKYHVGIIQDPPTIVWFILFSFFGQIDQKQKNHPSAFCLEMTADFFVF